MIMKKSKKNYSVTEGSLRQLQEGSLEEGFGKKPPPIPPPWFDEYRFLRGQAFYRTHLSSITFATHVSLVSGFAITNLLNPLMFTIPSDYPQKALPRYMATFYALLQWHTSNIFDKRSHAYQSLAKVKAMHYTVAEDMRRQLPEISYLSQYDMALVQCGFMGFVILHPEKVGIYCTAEELTDYIYFWKCVGYMLGIHDRYNVCASCDLNKTRKLVRQVEREVLLPAMLAPPKEFTAMADTYCSAINLLFRGWPVFTKQAVFAFTYNAIGFSMYNLHWGDWLRYIGYRAFFKLLAWCPVVKEKLNEHILQKFSYSESRFYAQNKGLLKTTQVLNG